MRDLRVPPANRLEALSGEIMTESEKIMRHRIARTVFVVGCILAVIAYRLFEPAVYPLYVITFPSCLFLAVAPLDSAFDAFAVLIFSSWLNGHLLGWLIWRFARIRKRRDLRNELCSSHEEECGCRD